MRLRITSLLICLSLMSLVVVASAEDAQETPVVAELFTSQGCSSCPPAEKLFSDLADHSGLITIEWHVDYWDSLVHGGSNWKDPYSSADYTTRQRDYNRALRGTGAVYTPQAVINGRAELVGSRRRDVESTIAKASPLPLTVTIADNQVTVTGGAPAADVTFIRLLEQHETDVKGGENKGRQLSGRNIALSATTLGKWSGRRVAFDLPAVDAGETCAVIVQDRIGNTVGPILGAAACPA